MALRGSNFCYNGAINGIRKLHSFPSCINNFGMPHLFSSAPPQQYKLGLAKICGKVQFYHKSCRSANWKNTRTAPFRRPSTSISIQCQAKNEDTDGITSSESIALDEQTLEQDLQIAIAEENYAKAAKIRDSLKALQEDSRSSVLLANARFYESFRTGDLAVMQNLWAKGDEVCCVHPGMRGISGYEDVMTSWEYVWANYEFPLEIQLKDVKVHVRGDVGYVTCVELVKTKGSSWGGQFATNVFERIEGQWCICIHHASHVDL